jgi:hypothetical protein
MSSQPTNSQSAFIMAIEGVFGSNSRLVDRINVEVLPQGCNLQIRWQNGPTFFGVNDKKGGTAASLPGCASQTETKGNATKLDADKNIYRATTPSFPP